MGLDSGVTRTEVVQSIQNNVKRPEPRHVEPRVFDVGVDRVYPYMGIECRCGACGDLSISVFVSIMRPIHI